MKALFLSNANDRKVLDIFFTFYTSVVFADHVYDRQEAPKAFILV